MVGVGGVLGGDVRGASGSVLRLLGVVVPGRSLLLLSSLLVLAIELSSLLLNTVAAACFHVGTGGAAMVSSLEYKSAGVFRLLALLARKQAASAAVPCWTI